MAEEDDFPYMDKLKEMFESSDEKAMQEHMKKQLENMDLDAEVSDKITSVEKQERGDCVKANASAFLWHLSEGRYPTEAKILPNQGDNRGGKWHQLPEFQKLIKNAYDWKLIQGTIINQQDLHPMAHCWCEASVEDIQGVWKHFNSPDGRFVFDFTSNNGILCLQSVTQFNILGQVPPAEHAFTWEGYEWLYKRFEYTFDEFAEIAHKPGNLGQWKFYEFDADKVDQHAGRIK